MVFAKEFFDLQFSFAEKVQALSGMDLERALFEYTNFYVRFGLGRELDREHEGWLAYLDGLRSANDGREWTYRFYLKDPEATTGPPVVATFGCFSYALQSAKVVRLHFRNAEADGRSPLAAASVEQRRAELTALFKHLKRTTDEDVAVLGISWLYNLNAYRRLFPVTYVSSGRVVRGRFQSMPLWGQFLNHRGQVKPSVKEPFLSAIAEHATLAALDDCFPLQVLIVQHTELVDALESRRARLVAGPVENFVPGRRGRAPTFNVQGVPFCMSFKPIHRGWFASSKGLVRDGVNVRIWHIHLRIARMEIERVGGKGRARLTP